MKQLKKVIKDNEDRLSEAIYTDFKKSKFDTFTNELALLYLDIDEAVAKVNKWSMRKRVGTNLINFPAKSYIYPEPLGTCLVIVFFMKDSLSTMALLGILFITSMISITSVHGIIVHSVDIKKKCKVFNFLY